MPTTRRVEPHVLANTQRALTRLQEFIDEVVGEPRASSMAAVVQGFEFSFELMWKLLKRYAESEGETPKSPKQAVAAAFRLGVFKDEQLWLDMLDARNLTVHTYNEDTARDVFNDIVQRFAPAMWAALKHVGEA